MTALKRRTRYDFEEISTVFDLCLLLQIFCGKIQEFANYRFCYVRGCIWREFTNLVDTPILVFESRYSIASYFSVCVYTIASNQMLSSVSLWNRVLWKSSQRMMHWNEYLLLVGKKPFFWTCCDAVVCIFFNDWDTCISLYHWQSIFLFEILGKKMKRYKSIILMSGGFSSTCFYHDQTAWQSNFVFNKTQWVKSYKLLAHVLRANKTG